MRQCGLVSPSPLPFYYRLLGEAAETVALMHLIHTQFLETPWSDSCEMRCTCGGKGMRSAAGGSGG